MRLQWALLLGAVLGAQAQGVVKRQDNSSEAPSDETTTAPAESTSSADEASSTSEPATSSVVTSSSGGDDDSDTTVFRTVTVTNNDVETVSSVTTVFVTSTRTVVVTETKIDTSTVTEDGETSTDTIFETSTHWVNKRDLSPRTLDAEDEFVAAAAPYTTVPEDWAEARPAQGAHGLAKRATVTRATTITVDGDGDATTVLSTARRTVITTVESETTTTSVVTKTAQANARTTVTVTSTLTVTSTSLSTGAVTTSPPEESGDPNSEQGGDSNSSNDDGGLSTGAKAGIGAGVGVAGLLVIGGLLWFCLKRRRSAKAEHDDLIGASEVPVGGPVGSGHTPSTTAHHSAAAAFLAPSRTSTKPSHSPEGYRGTAMGDGRAGFAKPAPYGSAYAGAVSPTTAYSQPTDYSHQPTDRSSTLVSHSPDGLPEHPTPQSAAAELAQDGTAARWNEPGAAEIDSRPAMSHQSGPVYEMPSQSYR